MSGLGDACFQRTVPKSTSYMPNHPRVGNVCLEQGMVKAIKKLGSECPEAHAYYIEKVTMADNSIRSSKNNTCDGKEKKSSRSAGGDRNLQG